MTQPTEVADQAKLYDDLLQKALQARKNSYSPYSHFAVGAALLAKDGRVYTGCNVENISYGNTICAERVAFVKAVSEGQRDFVAIAVAAESGADVWPCGVCRQYMLEFGDGLTVVARTPVGKIKTSNLGALLPHSPKP